MLGKAINNIDCYYILRKEKSASKKKMDKNSSFEVEVSDKFNDIKNKIKPKTTIENSDKNIKNNKGINTEKYINTSEIKNKSNNIKVKISIPKDKNHILSNDFINKFKRFEINSREAISKKKNIS